MRKIASRISLLLLVSLVMLISLVAVCQAEKNLYLDLRAQGEVTSQQFHAYLIRLAPEQLLLMGKQACQYWEDAGYGDDPGIGYSIFGIMQVYVEKMAGKPDVAKLFNIMNDKKECVTWRWFIIEWIDEIGYQYLLVEEQGQLRHYLEEFIKDKNDNPRIRTLSISFLSNSTYRGYKRALKADQKDIVATLEKEVRRNVLTLLDIMEDYSDDREVIEAAIGHLARYWKLNTPLSPKINEELLRAFGKRKQYTPKCQVTLANVLVLTIGNKTILPEVHKMLEETEDKELRSSIHRLLRKAERAEGQ